LQCDDTKSNKATLTEVIRLSNYYDFKCDFCTSNYVDKSPKGRILLVDDEQDITTITKKGLQRSGFEVDAFNNPLEALSSFKANQYDVALLDIRMPSMNGFDLYKKLRKIDSNIKVCFITAFEMYEEEFKKMFPSYNIRCFISKPIRLTDLVEQLEKMLVSSS
jgi:DNA-binding response OmpR family regulator